MEGIYYIISKEHLLSLIEDSITLTALENGGVDNWEWYGESINDLLKDTKANSIEGLAEKDLLCYKEVL